MSAADPTVAELSEAAVLRRILSRLPASTSPVGPGDDAAVLSTGGGDVVASVDTLVRGADFRLAWSSGFDLGWKSAAVNLADIAAMGARPTALLVALAIPPDTRVALLEELADGLREACGALAPGCAVEGGDLAVSATFTIAVTALGVLDGRPPVRRDGAQVGDQVAVHGELGAAARGLALLFDRFRDASGRALPVDPATLGDAARDDLAAQLRPVPPVAAGRIAADAGATAMMDVSDGLLLDASRLAAASGVTIRLESAALGADLPNALSGGEDHALLATFPAATTLPDGFVRIGEVAAPGSDAVLVDGRPAGGRLGWDPYRDGDPAAG